MRPQVPSRSFETTNSANPAKAKQAPPRLITNGFPKVFAAQEAGTAVTEPASTMRAERRPT